MKYLLLLLFLCPLAPISAQESNTNELCDEEIEAFAKDICDTARRLSRGDSISEAGQLILNRFINKFGIDKNDPNYKQLVAAVYNKFAACLICTGKPSFRSRNPEQFMKRVVSLGMYESILYDFLLYDEEEYPIDVNTIEMVNGKPETLLDYIDLILADPQVERKYDKNEIYVLRETIIDDYGAKKASELEN